MGFAIDLWQNPLDTLFRPRHAVSGGWGGVGIAVITICHENHNLHLRGGASEKEDSACYVTFTQVQQSLRQFTEQMP